MIVLYFSVTITETVILQLLSVQINSGFLFRLSSVVLFILRIKGHPPYVSDSACMLLKNDWIHIIIGDFGDSRDFLFQKC